MPRSDARRGRDTKGQSSTSAKTASRVHPDGAGRIAPATAEIAPELVALLAYPYWEERGRHGGSPEEDWFRAEQQLRAGIQRA